MNKKKEIAKLIISELDSFKENFAPQTLQPITTEKAFHSFAKPVSNAKEIFKINETKQLLKNEPFVAYIKVVERDVNKNDEEINTQEAIYLISRHGFPDINPITKSARFVSYGAYLEKVAEAEIGEVEDYKLFDKNGNLKKIKRVKVIEKDIFTFSKEEWDAINNTFYFDENTEFEESLRKLAKSSIKKGYISPPRWKRNLTKVFGLTDRSILDGDKEQPEIFRQLPLSSQIILTGFPGTGKTTTLIKRLSFKSNAEHLLETENIRVENNDLDKWILFTPNELLRTYLKEAMSKEGLSASNKKVRIWDNERIRLGREALKLLKVGKKGIFTTTELHLLLYNHSSELLNYVDNFTVFFKDEFKRKFQDKENYKNSNFHKIIQQVPKSYKRFRISLLKDKNTKTLNYSLKNEIKKNKISSVELDILIFSMLKIANEIFKDNNELLVKNSRNEILENIKYEYQTQIAADEATDFSVIQLGCIYYLSHPNYSSVTFAGDLMQRVTDFGLLNWDECKYISNKFTKKNLLTPHRQTSILLQIAARLYENITKQKPLLNLDKVIIEESPQPLKLQSNDSLEIGKWLVDRILEIYEIKNYLPTVAIFVPQDVDIDYIYEIIQPRLYNNSIEVERCRQETTIGEDSKVRIFSVEFIKGLEFDAAFFVNIDEIENQTLIDKYLYVGLTRAKTFLGVTCKTKFPKNINFVEDDFKNDNWSKFIS